MDKKTVSQGVRNLCKPIAIIYGSGILLALVFYILCFYAMDLSEVTGAITNALCMISFMVFGIFSFYVLVPGIAVLTLIIGGIVYAIREKNSKNIFNFTLWGTVVLVVLNTVLQLDVMSYMF